jgi:hypothetical protein
LPTVQPAPLDARLAGDHRQPHPHHLCYPDMCANRHVGIAIRIGYGDTPIHHWYSVKRYRGKREKFNYFRYSSIHLWYAMERGAHGVGAMRCGKGNRRINSTRPDSAAGRSPPHSPAAGQGPMATDRVQRAHSHTRWPGPAGGTCVGHAGSTARRRAHLRWWTASTRGELQPGVERWGEGGGGGCSGGMEYAPTVRLKGENRA